MPGILGKGRPPKPQLYASGRFLSLRVIIPTEHGACHRCPRSAVFVSGRAQPPRPVSVWPRGGDTLRRRQVLPSRTSAPLLPHFPDSIHPLLPSASFPPKKGPSPHICTEAPQSRRESWGRVQASLTSESRGLQGTQDSKDPGPGTVLWGQPPHVATPRSSCFSPGALILATVWLGPHCPRTWHLT